MATTEERLKILKMLEDGSITAEEAGTLLRALDGSRGPSGPDAPRPPRPPQPPGMDARFLRILVTSLDSGVNRVNITLPIGLVNAGLRMAARFVPGFEMDMVELEDMLSSGATGKIMEVTDPEENELVEMFIE